VSNFRYIVDFCQQKLRLPETAKCLDYGCGGGEVVGLARKEGLDFSGCDLYYEGGDLSDRVAPELVDGGFVRRMTTDRIPWDDATFDVVVSNQVIEHVPDLERVLKELHRVLKPGGIVISLFPHREVWKEPHCGLPLLHRFQKNSEWRVPYASVLRYLGMGYFTDGIGRKAWAERFCHWIDDWCHYRSKDDVLGAFQRYFLDRQHFETDYFDARTSHLPGTRFLPRWLKLLVVRKYAGLVFTMRKAGSLSPHVQTQTA
jgi:SAM-dependent methyltransferase